jgi:hypothetical protein
MKTIGTTMIILSVAIIILLTAIWVRMGHLIDAYADNPISRQWIQNCEYDVKALPGSNIYIPENDKKKN